MDWYNENEYRDYPFKLAGANTLPQATIVDFGAIMGPDSGFDSAEDSIWLHSVTVGAGVVTFEFHTSAVGAGACIFTRAEDAAEFATDREDAASELWEAFLVTGRLEDIVDELGGGGTRTFAAGLWTVEPCRIINLATTSVKSISLANKLRTLVTAPGGCDSLGAADADDAHAYIEQLTGALVLQEGYNTVIRQDDVGKSLTITAGKGAGDGLPCEEVERWPTEAVQPGSKFLTGGPGCSELLKTLNGVGGKDLLISGGTGIIVEADPDNEHTLIVRVNSADFAAS